MKSITSLSIAAPIAFMLLATAPNVFSDDHDKKTDVTITEPIQVPGAVLQPGTYMFILLNSSSNRNIVEIKSEDGKKLYSMSFATRANRVDRTDKTVLTFYEMPQGAPNAVRQWFWPGDYDGQEFLYSHEEAAKIAAASHQKVGELTDKEAETVAAQGPAASDSRAALADQTASAPAPAQPATVPVDESAQQPAQQIASQPVQQPAPKETVVDQAVVAQAAPPADNSNSNNLVAQNYTPAPAPAPQDASSTSDSTGNSSLPKTASDFPLIGLVGLFSVASAVTLRLTR